MTIMTSSTASTTIATTPSTTFTLFVNGYTIPIVSHHRRQHYHRQNPHQGTTFQRITTTTTTDNMVVSLQQSSDNHMSSSSSSPYEYLWNFTDSSSDNDNDDIIAQQTSMALEDMENHMLLLDSSSSSIESNGAFHTTTTTIGNDDNICDDSTIVPTTPTSIDQSTTQPVSSIHHVASSTSTTGSSSSSSGESSSSTAAAALEPHIYHINKALVDTIYNILCTLYPTAATAASSSTTTTTASEINYFEKSFARFYVLETIARVPYFAYLCVLHLRESLGDRSYSGTYLATTTTATTPTDNESHSVEVNNSRLRAHYAEADNELHHLLIMESLGGNSNPTDRAIAQTMAVGYFFYVLFVYVMISPQAAYHLSELIEDHAYNTYDEFLNTYEKELKQLPVPFIAKQYYEHDNQYMQDLFRTVKDKFTDAMKDVNNSNTNILNSLYDVFVCIRNDEKEHWKTLCTLVQHDQLSAPTTAVDDTVFSVQSSKPKSSSDPLWKGWFL